MTSVPKLTIAIPLYNKEDLIDTCLSSIYEAGGNEEWISILIVNDGSTDSSLEKALLWEEKFENFTIISQENKGLSQTRNVLVRETTTEFIWFVDSDDEITKDALVTIKNDLQQAQSHADMFLYAMIQDSNGTQTGCGIIDYVFASAYESTIWTLNRKVVSVKDHPELLLCYPSCWSCVFRKSLITDNRLVFPPGIWYLSLIHI